MEQTTQKQAGPKADLLKIVSAFATEIALVLRRALRLLQKFGRRGFQLLDRCFFLRQVALQNLGDFLLT